MTNPRYRPAQWATRPAEFGRRDNIEWREPPWDDNRKYDQSLAARQQHRIAVAVRSAIRQQHGTMKAYSATEDEISYERLSTMLRGHTIMRLEDIGTLERSLRLRITINVEVARR